MHFLLDEHTLNKNVYLHKEAPVSGPLFGISIVCSDCGKRGASCLKTFRGLPPSHLCLPPPPAGIPRPAGKRKKRRLLRENLRGFPPSHLCLSPPPAGIPRPAGKREKRRLLRENLRGFPPRLCRYTPENRTCNSIVTVIHSTYTWQTPALPRRGVFIAIARQSAGASRE